MSDSNTPLHVAVQNGNLEIVQILLDSGFDVNTCNSQGQTPLYLATRAGHADIVSLLLKRGASLAHESATSNNEQASDSPSSTPASSSEPCVLTKDKESISELAESYTTTYILCFVADVIFQTAYYCTLSNEAFTSIRTQEEIDRSVGNMSIMFFFIIAALLIYNLVRFYQYLKRLWEEIPSSFIERSPARMAGYSLIPVFSWYWCFRSILGLVQTMNRVIAQRGYGKPLATTTIAITCVLWIGFDVGMLFFPDSAGGAFGSCIFNFVDVCITLYAVRLLTNNVFEFMDMKNEAV